MGQQTFLSRMASKGKWNLGPEGAASEVTTLRKEVQRLKEEVQEMTGVLESMKGEVEALKSTQLVTMTELEGQLEVLKEKLTIMIKGGGGGEEEEGGSEA